MKTTSDAILQQTHMVRTILFRNVKYTAKSLISCLYKVVLTLVQSDFFLVLYNVKVTMEKFQALHTINNVKSTYYN